MRTLKVLHVIGGGDTGGAMTHLLPLLSALRHVECEVRLLCLGEGGLADEAGRRGLEVHTLPMRNAWDPSVLPALRRALAGDGWDVVHTHGMRANLPVRAAFPLGRRRPCLFTTVHSDLLLDYASPALAQAYRAFDRVTLPRVDSIVCVSDSLRALLLGRGYPPERTVRIWSGIDWDVVGAAASGNESGNGTTIIPGGSGEGRALPTPARPPRLGTVARLAPVKDLGLLLEATAALRRSVPDAQCVIVGDGPERAPLESRARELGLGAGGPGGADDAGSSIGADGPADASGLGGPDGAVRFMGRVEGVGPILAGLDVYMVTSVFEGGVSMAVLEAMAMGLPVVTTDAGGVAEAVEDGVTGFVVRRDQERGALAAALAERAAALLSDPALRARMGAAGAARVKRLFLAEHAAAKTRQAYERCLVARGGLL